MRAKRLFIIILLLAGKAAFGQSDVLAQFKTLSTSPAPKDTAKASTAVYDHRIPDVFGGFGFVIGNSNAGAKINYGESRELFLGFGGGWLITKWDGIGFDIYYKSTSFYLAQDSGKTLPSKDIHQSEKLTFDNFGGRVFERIYMGKFFVDVGPYFEWTFFTKHVTWDSYSFSFGNTTKVTERQLNFTNPTSYGFIFMAGKNLLGPVIYFNYRLSNLFKSPSSQGIFYPELPKYVIGITLGIF